MTNLRLVAILATVLGAACGGGSSYPSNYTIPAESELKPFTPPDTEELVEEPEEDDAEEDAEASEPEAAAPAPAPAPAATPAKPAKPGK